MAIDLDAIDRMADAHDHDTRWQEARANGWRDAKAHGHIDAVRNRPMAPDNRDAADRIAQLGPKFIEARPRADRYVYVLLRQLAEIDPEAGRVGREWYDAKRADMTVEAGSDWINRLKAKIAGTSAATTPAPKVDVATPNPAWAEFRTTAARLIDMGGQHGAFFAIPNKDGADNDLAFYRVSTWEGATGPRYGLRQIIGGQADGTSVRDIARMLDIVRRIDTEPKEAMIRYGQKIGRCGHCHRTLTNEVSRGFGMGPKCRQAKGW